MTREINFPLNLIIASPYNAIMIKHILLCKDNLKLRKSTMNKRSRGGEERVAGGLI